MDAAITHFQHFMQQLPANSRASFTGKPDLLSSYLPTAPKGIVDAVIR
jgi:hypothetical protein